MEIFHTQYFGSINHSLLFLQNSPIEIPDFVWSTKIWVSHKKFNSAEIINYSNPEALVDSLSCDKENAEFKLGKYKECKNNVITYEVDQCNYDIVSHFKWVTETWEEHQRFYKKVKVTKKVSLDKKTSEIIENVNQKISFFKKHILSAYHQIASL